jgi:hypothetical protein
MTMSDVDAYRRTAYAEQPWDHSHPESKRAADLREQARVRRELASTETPVFDIPSLLGNLRRFGEVDDIPLLRKLPRRRSDLGAALIDMTGEIIRMLLERAEAHARIEREERTLITLMAPGPRDDASEYLAFRRGKLVAQGKNRRAVTAAIDQKRRTTNPHYHAIVLSVDELKNIELEGLLTTDRYELWEIVQDETLPAAARLRALDELIDRGDADVPAFAVGELERAHEDRAWCDGLIVGTERVIVKEPWLRERLTRSLLEHARALRGSGATPVLWAALRRYATLVPAKHAETLIEFLDDRPPHLNLTHQVVFQCVANVFSVSPPADDAPLDALRARVAGLATAYLRAEPLGSGDEASLAMTAFVAAAALGSAELERLEGLLLAHRERWLADAAAERLRALVSGWRSRSGDGTVALERAEQSIERLSSAFT